MQIRSPEQEYEGFQPAKNVLTEQSQFTAQQEKFKSQLKELNAMGNEINRMKHENKRTKTSIQRMKSFNNQRKLRGLREQSEGRHF